MPRNGRDRASAGDRRNRPAAGTRYRHPVPSRTEIMKAMEEAGRPLTLVSLAGQLRLKGSKHEAALKRRLNAMVRDGQLIRNRAREFCLAHHLDLVIGQVHAHRDGYGFLTPDNGDVDVFLSSREMGRLWGGDRVAARVSVTNRGSEGRVVEILRRAVQEVAGRLIRERGFHWVEVEGRERAKVLIPRGQGLGARADDMVRVEITEHPTRRTNAIGRVSRVLGRFDDPGAQTMSAILSHGIPHEFSPQVEAEAAKMPSGVSQGARRGREDLRNLPLVTIDGADAKDFDDAVYCEPGGDGWRLIVAIADVGHYVRAGTGLDEAAGDRATSVYFPDRVVPMLPEPLSNGLCSLQPHRDRLCLCCDMAVSRQGEVKQSRFYEAVMRSARRFTYGEAARLLSGQPGDGDATSADAATMRSLEALANVHAAFLARRRERGGLEFNLGEVALELDDRGGIAAVAPRPRLITHRIIEECMIAANVEAARYLKKARIPTLYRVHDGPNPERTEELILFLRTLGFTSVSPRSLQPGDLNRILEETAASPEAELVETMLLRCMARADYRPRNLGHFGLALPAYAHFTSPIRRYPDLLVHRAIKHLLRHGRAKGFNYDMPAMEQLGRQCSSAEQRADEAVRDVEQRLKCAFLKDRIGDDFTVAVAGIAPYGLFVRVPELRIDGLVHVTSLPRDYYHVSAGGSAFTGENSGVSYRLADRLQVRLTSVSVRDRKIDFVPVARMIEARP